VPEANMLIVGSQTAEDFPSHNSINHSRLNARYELGLDEGDTVLFYATTYDISIYNTKSCAEVLELLISSLSKAVSVHGLKDPVLYIKYHPSPTSDATFSYSRNQYPLQAFEPLTKLGYRVRLANAIDTEPVPGKTVAYVRTGLEIARALGELHGLGIFHVDLNPMNILLRLEHRRPIVRIIDFESSYDSERHATGVFYNPPNTPGYSAPEISTHPPDARADVFSLGAVLYTMLLGYKWRREVEAGQALSGDRPLDRDLEGILLKAIDQQPEHRYPSVDEFQASLAAYLEGIWPGRKSAGWT